MRFLNEAFVGYGQWGLFPGLTPSDFFDRGLKFRGSSITVAFRLNVFLGVGRERRRPQAAPLGLRAAGGDGGGISRGDGSRVAFSGSSVSPRQVKLRVHSPCPPRGGRVPAVPHGTRGGPRGLGSGGRSRLRGDAKTFPRQGWPEQRRDGEQEHRLEHGWEEPRCFGQDAGLMHPLLPVLCRDRQSCLCSGCRAGLRHGGSGACRERPIFIVPLVGSCFLVSDCKQV